MNELIKRARELCEKASTEKANGNAVDSAALSWAIVKNIVPQLCDALEAAEKEIERLKAENKRLDIEDAKDALRGDTLRGELYDMTARAEKAEAKIKSIHIVDAQPSVDAVKVIRCRDCVHFGECLVTENDYCSKGERKEYEHGQSHD
jgi:hypothetical protein